MFGLHSRIPTCCINFFVDEWDGRSMFRDIGSAYHRALDSAKAGYVLCPACLGRGNKVQIRDCRIECGRDHQEDFYRD
jgi:hypothetical protein